MTFPLFHSNAYRFPFVPSSSLCKQCSNDRFVRVFVILLYYLLPVSGAFLFSGTLFPVRTFGTLSVGRKERKARNTIENVQHNKIEAD